MSFRFDHAIIAVDDLETAVQDYEELGFTVLEGGVHADGATHNALICFRDGSYIELLAPTGEKPSGKKKSGFLDVLELGGGLVGYALLSDDLDADIADMKKRKIKVVDVRDGGRTRQDGDELEWKTAMLEGTLSPFFIQDITERDKRVPADLGSITHPNQVEGIVEVGFVSDDLPALIGFYEAVLGTYGDKFNDETTFQVGDTTLALLPAKSREKREHAASRPDMPFDLVLRTSGYRWAQTVEFENTHGARFRLLAHVDT